MVGRKEESLAPFQCLSLAEKTVTISYKGCRFIAIRYTVETL